MLEVAEAQTAPITMVGASPDALRLGKIICPVLLTKTEGKAFSIVHLTARGAGAEAWKLLHTEYAGSSGNMVRGMVCWREQWSVDVNAGKDSLTSMIEWEIKVAAYETARGDKISEAVRMATIMDHAPDAVKSTLRLSPLEQRRNVLRNRAGCDRRRGSDVLGVARRKHRVHEGRAAAGKTVTEHLVEGGKHFVEQFYRRRFRLRCDGEPTTLAYSARLKELLPKST